jgi:hypothetical protein
MPDYPKRGHGRRHLNCEMFSACLEIAAVGNWKDFHCEGCPELLEFDAAPSKDPLGGSSFLVGQQKEPLMQDKKPVLCEECGVKPPMSVNGRLCASCMARRSNVNRSKKKTGKKKTKKAPPKPKSSPKPGIKEYMDRMETKVEEPVITVHFGEYKEILGQIKRLAGEETRSLELQIIHLLKRSLNVTQKSVDVR